MPGSHVKESTVPAAVVPFQADLLENRLGLRRWLEEEAQRMAEEDDVGMKRLVGQKEKAMVRLENAKELALDGTLTPQEARPVIEECREMLAKVDKQIEAIKQGFKVRHDLAEAINLASEDLEGRLSRLASRALQSLIQDVFDHFTVKCGRPEYSGKGLDSKL